VFNPNIGKLESKTVSCHFIGYPKKSKCFRFYCPDRYTKFVETRHAVFLEDEMMRGSMVAREIVLEEKWVCVSTPMIHKPFFELPVLVAPTVRDTVVQTPVVSSPVTKRMMMRNMFLRVLYKLVPQMRGTTTAPNRRCVKCGGPEKVSKS
jgi:hypothetical protein